MERIDSLVPFAAVALGLAAFAWLFVGHEAMKASGGKRHQVFLALFGAAYLTGGGILLALAAWLG